MFGAEQPRQPQQLPEHDDIALPACGLLQGLEISGRDRVALRGCCFSLFTALFVLVVLVVHPIPAAFEIHRSIYEELAQTAIAPQTYRSKRDFRTLGSYEEFWQWAEHVLYQRVYSGTTTASRFSVAQYNRLLTPIRLRQVRVSSENCEVPADSHELSRPCWPPYSDNDVELQSRLAGASFVADGLSTIRVGEGGGGFYGEGGHIVDLELDAAKALAKLREAVRDRWTDERTRALAVDVNTYNPNYDLATVARLKIDRSLGGKLESHVELYSCRLCPHCGARGGVRLVLEVVWACAFLIYVAVAVGTFLWWCKFAGLRRVLSSLWPWLELLYMGMLVMVVLQWADYLAKDREAFRSRHVSQFHDLYEVCGTLDGVESWAAAAVLLTAVRLAWYWGLLSPRLGLFWRALARAMVAAMPFAVLLLLAVVAVGLAGLWMFGARTDGLDIWWQAAGLLLASVTSGFRSTRLSEGMAVKQRASDVSPVMAFLWHVAWACLSTLIFANVFVSILVVAFNSAREDLAKQRHAMRDLPPLPGWFLYIKSKFLCLFRGIDSREPLLKVQHLHRVWSAQLAQVDRDKLRELLRACIDRGDLEFSVEDAMPLFPVAPSVSPLAQEQREEESYLRAATWMHEVSLHTGLHSTRSSRSTAELETLLLTQRLCGLEEEVLGLTKQLQPVIPRVPRVRAI